MRQNGRGGEDLTRFGQRERSFNGLLTSPADRSNADYRLSNGNQGASKPASGMPLRKSMYILITFHDIMFLYGAPIIVCEQFCLVMQWNAVYGAV